MRRIVPLVVIVLAAVLAGCSSPAPAATADQVVGELATKVPTAQSGPVITAENDPNRLLGRPGGYTSAAAFADSRVPGDRRQPDGLGIENGGKVEVFASETEATSRLEYLQGIAKAAPGLASEYTFRRGPTVVRVTGDLTPDQARDYEAALAAQPV